MNELWLILVISFLTGVTASLGLGGGFILVVYLTIFTEITQIQAQGINLIFFIPIAVLSLIIHLKNGFIERKVLIPCIAFSLIGAVLGVFISSTINSQQLSKLFAGFILIIGLKEAWVAFRDIKSKKKRKDSFEIELFITNKDSSS